MDCLPHELRSQLRKIKHGHEVLGPRDMQVVEIVYSLGGEVTIDQVLIEMWRRHKVVLKRSLAGGRLYRAAQKGVIQAVPNRKGIYRSAQAPFRGWTNPAPDASVAYVTTGEHYSTTLPAQAAVPTPSNTEEPT